MKYFKRENYLAPIRGFYHDADMIKVITGIRRCGKSTLLEMIKDELLESGIPAAQIAHIKLDRRGFKNITTPDALEAAIDAVMDPARMNYLFIDEVQRVEGFEDVLNAYREERNYSIFITGSNSYLLSGELITKLTGRYLEFEMQTLTFDEYVRMKEAYGKPVDANLQAELEEYILVGGFPHAVLLDTLEDKRKYVEGVVAEIMEKDIRRRAKVRHLSVVERVMGYILNNFAAPTSIKGIRDYFVNVEGLAITEDTVARYIRILENAKVISRCSRFDMKSRRALAGEQKYYLADLGIYFSRNTDNRINYGPVFENLVYNYAKSRGYTASVGRIGQLECAFILRRHSFEYAYTQVAYTILASKTTEDREYRPLELIHDNYPKYVLTADTLLQRRSGIVHANIMEFMKDGKLFE